MIYDYIHALRTRIGEEVTASGEAIARGSADDFPSYKYLAGRIQGLRLALEIINDLAKKVETDDDD